MICKRIEAIKKNTNEQFICELDTCYVVLGDSQFYKGYSLLLSKDHKTELHQLKESIKLQYLKEMSVVAQAIQMVFSPIKLNYELLGNRHPHLHWHIFPRYEDDPDIHNPVWIIDKEIRNHTILNENDLEKRKATLKKAIFSLLYV